MGYFSNLAMNYAPYDCSFTSPQQQLLWRLEELEDRYCELTKQQSGRLDEGVCFSREELRYVLPEHFTSAANVGMAIDLAIQDLKDRYGIRIRKEPVEEPPATDELTGMQISILDLPALQGVPLSAA